MGAPRIGEVVDGYSYAGGDPNSKASWQWVGDGATGGAANGFDAAANSPKYQSTLAQWRAKSDIKRLEDAQQIETQAYANQETAKQAASFLPGTPTGTLADMRIAAGKWLGNTPLAALPFIPNREETANLENVKALGNQGALGDVKELKGPLSDRDVKFLQSLQYDVGATPQRNQFVAKAQQWKANRQAAYASALRTWTEKLGSPSALNSRGESFDRWWGGYAAHNLPAPGMPRPSVDSRRLPQKNGASAMSDAQLKAELGL
jgi:hypothetical protein